jgi:hypothetical protein
MRRDFLKTILTIPALTALQSIGAIVPASAQEKVSMPIHSTSRF